MSVQGLEIRTESRASDTETAPAPQAQSDASPAPISESQWSKILDGRPFAVLAKEEQREWAGANAVRCSHCQRASDVHGDPWSGFCLAHRVMVSNTFPKLCRRYEARR